MEECGPKMVPVREPASDGEVGGCSASATMPPTWNPDAFECDRTSSMRASIRGMEVQLMDLVFQNSTSERLMDWLKIPLECAASAGNLAVVKHLLVAGVKTEAPPQRSRPAPLLHLAAKGGSEGVVDELLKAGVDVHETDGARRNRTALHCAAAEGSDAVVRVLIGAGARIDVIDTTGRTPLDLACNNGHRGVVVFLLLNGACGQDVIADEYAPVLLAAANNHSGVIEDLLSFGNVSFGRNDEIGQSALCLAARYGGVDACVTLLRGGASVGRTSSGGFNCLDFAVMMGHTGRLLQVLTAAEAMEDRKLMCSKALGLAVGTNKDKTIRDLVALGADVEYTTAGSVPYLHRAASRGRPKTVEALLRAGANVEARSGGSTPLHVACSHSHASVVQLLLYWGADENVTDADDNTPSDVVGSHTLSAHEELRLPDEVASDKLKEHVEGGIRIMLQSAPADRSWRRRGWLVLCRARWLSRVGELGSISEYTAGAKKRRGELSDSALVLNPNDLSLYRGKANQRNESGGRHLPDASAPPAEVLSLGQCSFSRDGGAGTAAGNARLEGKTLFVAAVEQLLLLREDSIFREVVTFV